MINYNGANEMFSDMTNYDVFMLNKSKKKAESKLFDRKNDSVDVISYENYRKKSNTSESKANKSYDYKTYLKAQLERSTPEQILTEEQFYGRNKSKKVIDKSNYSRNVAKETKNNPSIASKMIKKLFGNVEIKKGGKIFIGIYVLIVIAVASILIVANTASPFIGQHAVDADGSNYEQTESSVKPMAIVETREEESNWFDKLCDSLKK